MSAKILFSYSDGSTSEEISVIGDIWESIHIPTDVVSFELITSSGNYDFYLERRPTKKKRGKK